MVRLCISGDCNNKISLSLRLWHVGFFVLALVVLVADGSFGSNVVEEMMGDQLETLASNDGDGSSASSQYAVYDCTRNLTIVYDTSLMPEDTSEPTDVPTSKPITPPTSSQPTVPPSTSTPTGTPTAATAPSAIPSTLSPTIAETTVPPLPISIVPNFDFEQDFDTVPWTANGGATIAREFDTQRNSYVGTAKNRNTATWQGIGIDVTNLLEIGEEYNFKMSARLLDVPPDTTARLKLTLAITDDSGTKYPGAIFTSNGLTGEWKTFTGKYGPLEVTGTLQNIFLFAEGPEIGRDFAIDDVLVTPDLTTPDPTIAPTPKSTQPDSLVSSDDNTEIVTIPQPPSADFSPNVARTNCPHEDDDLVDFNSYFGTNLWNGQDLTIPDGMTMIIRQSVSTTLGLVTIPVTSTLIIGEDGSGIDIDVNGMIVEGSVIAGSETCRLQTPVTITLHGDRPASVEVPEHKGISVKGLLSLHGKRYYRTMTRLAKRVYPGDTSLYLQDEVNWEPGQEIVLVTTAIRDSRDWHENEIFIIEQVETNNMPFPEVKTIVHLTAAVNFDHIARPEYQAEVGLLTRVIKIQGALDDSLPTDTSPSSCQLVDHNGRNRSVFGYNQVDCPNTYNTGYGGHIMIHEGGRGYVEGVELTRMGQTNFLGRYPIHFHQLGDGCSDCYWKDSSVHESYYRCISIHGTNNLTVTENVAYDVTGFCYYLEDGVEEFNEISFNLAAHIHFIGDPALGDSQRINYVTASSDLTLPADVTAAGFYITNLHNTIVGNVASGGWAGFAFPVFDKPGGGSGPNTDLPISPRERPSLRIDGNTAHSTAHFWSSAAGFYFGGALFTNDDNQLVYNAGRDRQGSQRRSPCIDDDETGDCISTQNRITNSKVYLIPNVGIGSWNGKMEVVRYEAHDVGLSLEALVSGFWIDQMSVTCRTSELLKLPVQQARYIRANGFVWYDTGQDHIITDSKFTNCGYRSDEYNQYDTSVTRGCDDNDGFGCSDRSSVFGFLTHSDQFNPEIMQATRNITMTEVGRRFRFSRTDIESVSGRSQNWLDTDGTVTGLGSVENPKPTLIGSGLPSALSWWNVDDEAVVDSQGPLVFVQKDNGPARGLAHVRFEWNDALHDTVGSTACVNGRSVQDGPFCPPHGYIRHVGEMFVDDAGLPVTAQPEVVGLAGGFGWLLKLNDGAPRELKIMEVEVLPNTPLLLSIQYPIGTLISVTAKAASWCYASCDVSCEERFSEVPTIEDVRQSDGNVYHYDSSTGLLTLRAIMYPQSFTGEPSWKLYDFDDVRKFGDGYALDRYERKGVLLPRRSNGSAHISVVADCPAGGPNGAHCSSTLANDSNVDNVCATPGYVQMSYDRCCDPNDVSICEYPYSMTPPPTTDPTSPAAPTPADPELLVNGDFEGGPCPWEVSWNVDSTEETTIVQKGESSLRISGRTQSWQGPGQSIFGKLQLGVTYDFTGWVYLLSGGTTNRVVINTQLQYDTSTGSCTEQYQYRAVYNSGNTLSGNGWNFMSSSYTLSSDDLQDGCTLIGLRIYAETPGATMDFIVDGFSLQSSSSQRFLRRTTTSFPLP